MLNYRSVTNSEPQVRSNPALRNANSAFQKKIETLLQDIQPTFPTYARIMPKHEPILSKHPFHVWTRPAHLRSSWIIIHDTLPVLIVDSKNLKQANTIRIPYKKERIQELGTILCEGAWDAQDHKLWIWDVVYWNRTNVWNSEPYSKRWDLVKEVIGEILDVGNPMSDAQVSTPLFETLSEVRKRKEVDSAIAIEFQPESKGQRRFLFQSFQKKPFTKEPREQKQRTERTEKTERKVPEFSFVDDEESKVEETEISLPVKQEKQEPEISLPQKPKKKLQYVKLIKDTYSKVPDAYRVIHNDEDKGLLAVRSMEMSKKLRTLFQKQEQCVADVEWFESFQKYELTQLYIAA